MTEPDISRSGSDKPTNAVNPILASTQTKTRWIWLGTGGCGLFLCLLLVGLGSMFLYGRNNTALGLGTSTVFSVPVNNSTVQPTVAPVSEVLSPVSVPGVAEIEATQIALAALLTPTPSPTFGPICFKPVTTNGTSATCDTTFPPTVVEVHAIFDYLNLNPNHHQWTRIWYHNGQEVLKVEEIWTGDSSGQFDYNLNTTDGQPLSAGTWELELYAGGQLQTYGAFVVNPPSTPTALPVQATAIPQNTPVVAGTYQLAYTQWDGSKHSIWVANLDGSNPQFLLDFAASPSWSADGRQIAFFGEEGIDTQEAVVGGTNGIWLMDATGQNATQLVPDGSVHAVNWAAEGNTIAFDAARGGPDRRIYFVDVNGASQPFEILGEQPAFSPDGLRIVAKACRPECGLWITDKNGANPFHLTQEGSDGLPVWSPDGSKIAFSRNVDGNVDIYLINPDGTGLQRLTNAPGNDSVPAWTPDSGQLVFRSTRNGIWQIFVMNADGTNQQLIIDDVGASDEWAFDRMSVK